MNIKKLFLITFTFCCITFALAATGEDAQAASSGSCGTGVSWKLDSGVLTISGTGKMTDFSVPTYVSWVSVKTQIKSVVVKSGVTSIGDWAFCGCENITSISLPSTLKTIGQSAFSQTAITNIEIPSGVTSIGTYAFSECTKLKTIELPEGIKTIPNYFLYDSTSIESFIIPETVTQIGDAAFADCTSLASITIPANVSAIGESAFDSCASMKDVYLKCMNAGIYSDAFCGCTTTMHYNIGLQTPRISYGGNLTWICDDPIIIDHVAISRAPSKTEYSMGDDSVDVTGGTLFVYYNDGSHKIVDITTDMVESFDFTEAGTKKVLLSYEGFNLVYDVVVKDEDDPGETPSEKTLTGIGISALPNKLDYVQGDETFEVAGGKISLLYSDGTFGKLNMSLGMISGFDTIAVGKQTITVTYKEFTVTFDINIVAEKKTVTQIVLSKTPAKTNYYVDEALNIAGGEITVYYADETYEVLMLTTDMISGFDDSEAGNKTIAVSYGGQSTQYDITVIERKTSTVEAVTNNQKAATDEVIEVLIRSTDTYSLKSGSLEVDAGDDFEIDSCECVIDGVTLSGGIDNKYVFTFTEMNDIMGNIFSLKLKADKNADISTITATLKLKNETETVTFDEVLSVKTKNLIGDLNRDGKVNTDDALYLLMHVSFPSAPEYEIEQGADYNQDNVVDTNDAIYLLMHVNFPSYYPLDPKISD